ncbi:MAG: hypothetical protein V5A68_05985 [Candidatus Thermoplasmatota archaeon]
MDFNYLDFGEILTRQFVYLLISFIVGTFLLHLATGVLSFKKRGFGKAIEVMLAGGTSSFILSFIPYIGNLLGLISYWFFIKSFYDVGWIKAIICWFMSILIAFIIAVAILIVLGMSVFFILPF